MPTRGELQDDMFRILTGIRYVSFGEDRVIWREVYPLEKDTPAKSEEEEDVIES